MTVRRNVSAFVLHRKPYRERGHWCSLYTYELGRINVISRGRQSSQLVPFQPLVVTVSGSGDLKTLSLAEAPEAAYRLTGLRLYCGFYINELLYRLLPLEDSHPDLLQTYMSVLSELAAEAPVEPLLRAFERQLMDSLGFDLVYPEPLQSGRRYQLAADSGQLVPAENSDSRACPGDLLGAVRDARWEVPQALRWAQRLQRQRLDFMLGNRSLESRRLIREYLELNKS